MLSTNVITECFRNNSYLSLFLIKSFQFREIQNGGVDKHGA